MAKAYFGTRKCSTLMSRRVDGIARHFSPLDSKMDDPSGVSVTGCRGNPFHIAWTKWSKSKRSPETNRWITGMDVRSSPCAKRAIEATIEERNMVRLEWPQLGVQT
jgi:hypothetical protein